MENHGRRAATRVFTIKIQLFFCDKKVISINQQALELLIQDYRIVQHFLVQIEQLITGKLCA